MPDVIAPTKADRAVPAPTPSAEGLATAGRPDTARIRRPQPETTITQVRAADLEPYIGLKYLSRLFKLMAVVLILLLVSEVITGLVASGMDALPTLLGEVSRLIVFAGLLWGSGDLAILFIDIGHDLRATRILMGRQLAHHTDEHHSHVDPAMAGASMGASVAGSSTAGTPGIGGSPGISPRGEESGAPV